MLTRSAGFSARHCGVRIYGLETVFRSRPLRGCCSEPTPRRLALDVEATVTHAGDAMQRIQISPGKALCRFCGQQISTNRLSTHIAKEHPRPGPIDMSPTLRKPAGVKKRPSK